MGKKTICFLAPANNNHTQKWCKWFYEQSYAVHVISFIEGYIENADVYVVGNSIKGSASDFQKLKYFTFVMKVKRIVKEIDPDIVSVHFASSYGLVAALANIKKYSLSVWGSDIFAFPNKSIFHKSLLLFSLNKADRILATSDALMKETQKYTRKKVEITPFGVDTHLFHPTNAYKDASNFVVGTIKAMTPRYGIDYLIKAAAIVLKEHPEIPLELHIAGRGEKEDEYKMLAQQLNICDKVDWLGYISQEEAAIEWSKMDVAVVYSAEEPFGVSAIEAQACGAPLIISDAPGLLEATKPGESSVVVPFGDERKLAESIMELYYDKEKRKKMGTIGREYVVKRYELNQCFLKIEKCLSE